MSAADQPPPVENAQAVLPARPAFSGTVFSPLPDTPAQTLSEAQEDVAQAIAFLEETTGLRYYPAPTLLVDDFAVRSVRVVQTVDHPPQAERPSEGNPLRERALVLSAFVGAVCLDFHRKVFHPPQVDYGKLLEYFGSGSLLTDDQFDAVRGFCQWPLDRLVEEHLTLRRWEIDRSNLTAFWPLVGRQRRFSSFVDHFLNQLARLFSRLLPQLGRGNAESVSTLVVCRQELARILPAFDEDHPAPAADFAYFEELQGYALNFAGLADSSCKSLLALTEHRDGLFPSEGMVGLSEEKWKTLAQLLHAGGDNGLIRTWLDDVAHAQRWKEPHSNLVALNLEAMPAACDFVGFLAAFLDIVYRLLRRGQQTLGEFDCTLSFSAAEEAWQVLQQEVSLRLQPLPPQEGQGARIQGLFSEVVRAFHFASQQLIAILSGAYRPHTTTIQRFFATEVQTYGIYAPPAPGINARLEQWAHKRGVAPQLTLPHSPRVLLCLNACQQFEERLQEEFPAQPDLAPLARQFQRCVLIHEHFHAIVDVGRDSQQAMAAGPADPDAWQRASRLNESLAVWMELHAVRANRYLRDMVVAYIEAGSYPEWPYRGAEYVEALYLLEERSAPNGGIKAVRSLITDFRREPAAEQVRLDLWMVKRSVYPGLFDLLGDVARAIEREGQPEQKSSLLERVFPFFFRSSERG